MVAICVPRAVTLTKYLKRHLKGRFRGLILGHPGLVFFLCLPEAELCGWPHAPQSSSLLHFLGGGEEVGQGHSSLQSQVHR